MDLPEGADRFKMVRVLCETRVLKATILVRQELRWSRPLHGRNPGAGSLLAFSRVTAKSPPNDRRCRE